jgi:hypothetical protein
MLHMARRFGCLLLVTAAATLVMPSLLIGEALHRTDGGGCFVSYHHPRGYRGD